MRYARTVLFSAIVLACGAALQLHGAEAAPAAPTAVYAVRVGPGVIGIEWTRGGGAAPVGYLLFRADKGAGPYELLAKRPGERAYYLDAKIQPERLYFYTVAAFNDESAPSEQAGPTCAWDSDQLVPNGSFELDVPGLVPEPACPMWWYRRAYNRQSPVLIVPGGLEGKQCVEVQASATCVSGGFHSMLIPMIEGERWYQEAWARNLPNASPLVGRCFFNAQRQPVSGEGITKAYDYTTAGEVRPDGWRQYTGEFTALPSTCYAQVWLIGFQATNTFWFDGAKVIDRTSKRVREFQLEVYKTDVAEALRTSAAARRHGQGLRELQTRIEELRGRLQGELDRLSPVEYRRLLVELDRAESEYVDEVWTVKTLAVLGD